ncbi:chromosome partitioning protein ParB [Tessaracoccus lapidicaptus]|uniref:Chromosome partitioning protein ParB n=1 Tax=Tessaracoccus lapidicaptus TaxID=1427523 RepID=A0A1C0ARW8_9ACTN|nr:MULTISPECIES: ParB/RepB/Spo0J family partition protein [Tessaracoccus]AQX15876.1 chromosome partitioning protein ParB [Tessaracoccus sp. T2.5-30]OCL37106.1 chromosome partitioning protein ParB [Tessaracoccus lapidicaptus]VEP40337.1 putative chromosome-partitioning protein ParB [Tessaracoccus lapidicaptus]
MAAMKKSALGQGLGDLFARTDADEVATLSDGSEFAEIPVGSISPNPQQPRTVFDEDDLQELAESIREFGVLQPIVVRRAGEGRFELVMGERRWRASQQAGRDTVPAIIRGTDDTALLRDALLENLHRANLNPIEEANAYAQLLQDFDCTKEDLAQRIHRSRPQVSNTLRLLNLPPRVQSKVAANVISAGHARALLGLDDAAEQERLADRIVAEGLSVRSTEEIVALGRGREEKRPMVRTPRMPSERERDLSTHLSDHFDTRVRVAIGRNKGKITIEFASGDDLERIMAILDGRTV